MAKQTVENGPQVIAYFDSLGDGGDFDVTPGDFTAGRTIEITTYVVGAACDVKYLSDAGGDFASPDVNVTIDSFSGAGISEDNATPLAEETTTLRLTNTSGSAADFAVVGHAPREDE